MINDGILYITPEEYEKAEKNGIPKKTVYNRVNSMCWSIERAIVQPVGKSARQAQYEKLVSEIKGRVARYNTFYERTKRGMKPEVAIQPVPVRKFTKKHREIALENGIPIKTVKARIYNYHWSVEDAVTKPVNEKYRRKEG